MHGEGGGACMAGGHVWQGVCMVGGGVSGRSGMHGGGYVWQEGHVWWGCAWWYSQWVGGTHPTGMHSCYILSKPFRWYSFNMYQITIAKRYASDSKLTETFAPPHTEWLIQLAASIPIAQCATTMSSSALPLLYPFTCRYCNHWLLNDPPLKVWSVLAISWIGSLVNGRAGVGFRCIVPRTVNLLRPLLLTVLVDVDLCLQLQFWYQIFVLSFSLLHSCLQKWFHKYTRSIPEACQEPVAF